jgi:hypothetical protein
MKRIIAVFAVLFLAAVSAAAQSRRWVLLGAEYGADESFVDVTSRVGSLIRGDTLSIRVDNQTLGGDPAPGARKILRLRVRDEDGRERVLTFSERDVVNLNIRRGEGDGGREGGRDRDRDREGDRDRIGPNGPPPPVAGGGLQILRADYGADNRFANVTGRLASRIRGDALSLRVTNYTMGGDPAEDHPKILNLWYSYNGRTAHVIVNEGDTLNLPSDRDFFAGHLRVMRAQYGVGRRYADVTDLLNSQIQGDQLSLRVTNYTMGGDPDPNRPKQLVVFYVYNGRPSRVIVNEKDYLNLPGNDAYGAGSAAYGQDQLEILSASYGAGDRRRDVTNLLASQVHDNSIQLVVSNDSMGGDPAEGQVKRLRVVYLWQGVRNQITVGEGETLAIP